MLDADVIRRGLRAFGRAGRPGFRSVQSAELDALRDLALGRRAGGAHSVDANDSLDLVVQAGVEALTESEVGPRLSQAAPIFFAMGETAVGLGITKRRELMRAIFGLQGPRSLYRRGGWECKLADELAARVLWPPPVERERSEFTEDHTIEVPPTEGEATVGRLRNAWLTVGVGPYCPQDIRIRTTPIERDYAPAIDEAFDAYCDEVNARAMGHRPVDNTCLRLTGFDVTGRTLEIEDPILRLSCEKTTYFRGQVTNWQLDRPIAIDGERTTQRRKWAAAVNLRRRPVPELANVWGIILAVVSVDDWLLLPLRGNTEVEPNCFGPSVGEEGLWQRDVGPDGAVDPFKLAHDGIRDELGIGLRADQVRWLELGVNTVCCRYALVGAVKLDLTRDQISVAMSSNAKDGWEIGRAFWPRFHPNSVAAFMSEPGRRFSPYGVAAIMRALIDTYGWDECDRAFANANVEIVRDALRGPRSP